MPLRRCWTPPSTASAADAATCTDNADDAPNAVLYSTAGLTINSQGDGLDSNGNAIISGGTVVVAVRSAGPGGY